MAGGVTPLDAGDILRRLQSAGFCSDLEPYSEEKPLPLFDRTLSAFLKVLGRKDELRSLPPVLHKGPSVELFRLFSAVRGMGGYSSVVASDSWGLVAEEMGVSPVAGSSLESIYMRYLYALEVWLDVIPCKRLRCNVDAGALKKMLEWVMKLAKSPRDPEIAMVHGYGEIFSMVLLVRNTMLLENLPWMSNAGSLWKDKQKMHPRLYEDPDVELRSSQRIKFLSEKRKTSSVEDAPTDLDESRVGEEYQAQLPDFSQRIPEPSMYPDELKWLGTRTWPCTEKKNSRTIQKRIGKGREGNCACENPGSIQCIGFHVSQKRLELMHELPKSFFDWSQDNIGEQVARSWTDKEQRRFKAIVRLNPPELETNLWDKLNQNFPCKRKRNLVSYYFNVFILRLRKHQNRTSGASIDSDDDEMHENSFGFLAL
ncbi:hypothetical protein J5N97_023548 [Dioscorea zingiberensis]|uniref:ARID domain-containing protein n=1 Tax=Dioscorea zingiberensis TaxID=325984 RepID=A0A9D5H7X5_9LILI|nr:hypothetical protein J5N97_023548 [Dioscorea zingiberensis]